MRVLVHREAAVAAPATAVWDYLVDWRRQGEWIPFTRVRVVAGPEDGVGGRLRARTGIGPVGFPDTMTITAWEPGQDGGGRCEVVHTGRVVRGEAEFRVRAAGPTAATVVWVERLDVPGGAVGRALWRLVGPVAGIGVGLALRRLGARMAASGGPDG